MRILIAEDVRMALRVLESQLVRWGYEVVVARDGHEAWAVLERPDAPRLAILDWMMPGIDGPEVCRRIRAQAQEPYIYALLLTGKQRTEDIVEGLDAGADDYVTKPFDAQELQVRLRVGTRIIGLQHELVAARDELRFQATHDGLTGLMNRTAAVAALHRELSRARREHISLSIAMIDIDHFKRVNDTLGHPAGDTVLTTLAARLQTSVRPYDVIGRYGGEEFLMVLPGCGPTQAAVVAERLRGELGGTPIDCGSTNLDVTCSIGIASTAGTLTPELLIERADAALYRAKAAGRNRVEVAVVDDPICLQPISMKP